MKKVEMYTKTVCPFCTQAKTLLTNKGVEIIEYNIEKDPSKREELLQRYEKIKGTKPRTVPQIFIEGELLEIDGFDGLKNADSQMENGKSLLDKKLGL